ncbi:hypothetical protein K491DRAFT_107355 [Lophiostoma macrostomum CBS 122681]|uniref:Uncharacterized protein n=1 Tax=Lophiostoma macrostomum CBS 122681 TaxID=1314788 RepID=A0A6A6TN53_9PLEO|nr:hypothetical protein K491DRAFT_107355 [Lophiostoma macrostomum CBS 122681]
MSFFKTCAVLALATGFAVAKPVHAPQAIVERRSPAVSRRQDLSGLGGLGGNGGNAFDFINGFNNVNQQNQVINIQEQSLQIVDNGRQQAIVQQAQQVLIVDQQKNGFNNDLNDIFRKTNARRDNRDQTVVMLVVQEIQVAVDDGKGNVVQEQVFAQSAVVANRGRGQTKTVMMFAAETIIAQNVLNGNNNNNFGIGAAGLSNGTAAALPTKTNDVQLLAAKPTWSEVAEDPAATVGNIWAQEIQDAQNVDNNAADNQVNADAAAAEKQALDQAAALANGTA